MVEKIDYLANVGKVSQSIVPFKHNTLISGSPLLSGETLAEHASDLIVRFDRNLRYLYVNPAVEKITGWPRNRFISKSNEELGIPKDLCRLWRTHLENVFETGHPVRFYFNFTTTNGLRCFEAFAAPETGPSGSMETIMCVTHDVTDQNLQSQNAQLTIETQTQTIQNQMLSLEKTITDLQEKNVALLAAQERLKKNKIQLRIAYRMAHLGSWEWDIQNNKVWWSEETYLIYGTDSKTYIPTLDNVLSVIHPDDRVLFNLALEAAIQGTEKYYSFEHRVLRPDGAVLSVFARADVLRDTSGKVVRMVGIVQDITDIREKERELQQQTELLDLAHDMIIMHDLEGRIIFWNKGAEKIYGWTQDEAIGKVAHKLFKSKFEESWMKIMATILRQETWEGEVVHLSKTGQRIVVESRWALQKNNQDQPCGILQIDRDITDRKKAEKVTQQSRRYAESIIEAAPFSLVVLDSDFKIISANESFYCLFNLMRKRKKARYLHILAQGQLDRPDLKKNLRQTLTQDISFLGYELHYTTSKGSVKTLLLSGRRLFQGVHKTDMILLSIQDVTALKQQEWQVRNLTEQLLMAEEQQRQKIAAVLHDSIG